MKNSPPKTIYLDYASATPLDAEVKNAMIGAMDSFANTSAIYHSARKTKELLDECRKKSAAFLQANYDEVYFTSGATESNNIAILGSCPVSENGSIITIKTEHSSVRGPISWLGSQGYKIDYVNVDKNGLISTDHLKSLLSKDTKLISVSYASSEIGTIQPISRISQIIKDFNLENNTKILFHTDASAASLLLACDISRFGVDLLSLGSQKLYGPSGVGLLYIRREVDTRPIEFGGVHDSSIKPGTQSIFLAAGLAKALEITKSRHKGDARHFRELHEHLLNTFERHKINYVYNGSPKDRLFNIANISVPGYDGLDLVARLDAKQIEISTGAACEISEDKPSEVLMAIGRSAEEARSSLRISFGRPSTKTDVDQLANALSDIINR